MAAMNQVCWNRWPPVDDVEAGDEDAEDGEDGHDAAAEGRAQQEAAAAVMLGDLVEAEHLKGDHGQHAGDGR